MAMNEGDRLGPYEILAPLGAGGMGEVYKARDTRLDRTVAVKVLPSHLAHHPESRQRFEREARAVSSLNHPHICSLFDVGEQGGVHYLVMEHLEGETIAARLQRGPLPVEEALRIGVQVAEALDRAHRQGVVHRDLKPGNVMLTRSGAKLLDFGLAKQGVEAAPPLSSVAMTMASPLTVEGTIVGTFQYMSPEQLEGKPADARSDIFSFGAVLFEMLTGRRAFEAKSQASLIAAILEREPPAASAIRPGIPATLDRVVRTCLAKDPDDRFQTAHDLRLQLKWMEEAGASLSGSGLAPAPGGTARRSAPFAFVAWVLVALLGVTAGYLAMKGGGSPAAPPARIVAAIPPPPGGGFDYSASHALALSPDGTRLVFGARDADGKPSLWLRELAQPAARKLAGTQNAASPFWSPDGRSLAFFLDGELRKMQLESGLVETLCETDYLNGGSWGAGGEIVLTISKEHGLSVIPATGGVPRPVTKYDGGGDREQGPSFLPDGKHFIYLVRRYGSEEKLGQIRLGSIDGSAPKVLFASNSQAIYSSTGHILWWQGGNLKAQRFDPDRLEMSGEPFPLLPDVLFDPGFGSTAVTVSANGHLVYLQEGAAVGNELVWLDRAGTLLRQIGSPGNYYSPRLSPDGRQFALDISGETNQGDIWTMDSERGTATRLTRSPEDESLPIWSPDGSRIVHFSFQGFREAAMVEIPSSGNGASRTLASDPDASLWAYDWSPEGFLIVTRIPRDLKGQRDLWVYSREGGSMRPWVATPALEDGPRIAPGGRYAAYHSDEAGQVDVYVQTFPEAGERWVVSARGGAQPVWRRDGAELYYIDPDGRLMAVPVRGIKEGPRGPGRAALEFGEPIVLFPSGISVSNADYDTRDGQRFLVNRKIRSGADVPLTLVLNWPAGLDGQ